MAGEALAEAHAADARSGNGAADVGEAGCAQVEPIPVRGAPRYFRNREDPLAEKGGRECHVRIKEGTSDSDCECKNLDEGNQRKLVNGHAVALPLDTNTLRERGYILAQASSMIQ